VEDEGPVGPQKLGELVVREGREPGKIPEFAGPLASERAPEIGYKDLRSLVEGHPTPGIDRGIPKQGKIRSEHFHKSLGRMFCLGKEIFCRTEALK